MPGAHSIYSRKAGMIIRPIVSIHLEPLSQQVKGSGSIIFRLKPTVEMPEAKPADHDKNE